MPTKHQIIKDKTRKTKLPPDAPAHPSFLGRFLSSPFYGAIFVFILTFLLYSNTFQNDFVWDDRDLIVENPRIRKLDGDALRSIFFENFFEGKSRIQGYYRPLVSLSYNIDYQFFGLNPGGFHSTNVFINALTCSLLLLFLYALFRSTMLALIAAVIFTAHPLHTETVAWVSGRTDLLATFWMIASLTGYVLWKQRRHVLFLSLFLVAFVLALLSKEVAAGFPLVILLLDLGPFQKLLAPHAKRGTHGSRDKKKPAGPRFPLMTLLCLVILILYFLLRKNVLGSSFATYEPYAAGMVNTIALAFTVFAGYCLKLIYPFRLNAEYDAPVPDSLFHPHAIVGFLLLVFILYAAYRFRRRGDVLLGLGIFFAGLVPVMNLIPLGEISAERFLYVPSVGFALVLSVIFTEASAGRGFLQRRTSSVVILLLLLVAGCSVQTYARNFDWRNEEILFRKTIEAAPGSARARLNMGNTFLRKGERQKAIAEFQKALEIDPHYSMALSNLAGVYMQLGKVDKTMQLIEKALQSAPENADLHNNLGTIFLQQARLAEAEKAFHQALKFSPDHSRARFNFGVVKFQTKDYEMARTLFDSVREDGPDFVLSYYYLGMIDASSGRSEKARRYIEVFLARYTKSDPYRTRAAELLQKIGR